MKPQVARIAAHSQVVIAIGTLPVAIVAVLVGWSVPIFVGLGVPILATIGIPIVVLVANQLRIGDGNANPYGSAPGKADYDDLPDELPPEQTSGQWLMQEINGGHAAQETALRNQQDDEGLAQQESTTGGRHEGTPAPPQWQPIRDRGGRSRMFTFHGRINRWQYWLGLIPLIVVSGFVRFALETGWAGEMWAVLLLWIPVGAYLGFMLMVKRLHDMGTSGWSSLMSLIPLIGIFYVLWLGFLSGDPHTNQYGPAPGRPAVADAPQETEIAPHDDGGKDDMLPPRDTAQETERLEPPIHYQRDDMEGERELLLQEFRRQQEERQRDWEQRREQLRAEQEANAQLTTEKPGGGMAGPPPDSGDVPPPAEPTTPAQSAAPMPSAAPGRQARRDFFLPLLVTCALIVVVVGAGALAYIVLASPGGTPTPEAVEPTPDLDATIAAAVAMIPALLTPSPVAQPEAGTAADAVPIATVPANAPPLPIPYGVAAPPSPTPASNRLPAIACPDCAIPDPPADGYIEWVREPTVSESGVLSFRARIDDRRVNFVVAGPSCGYGNVTLTDSDGAYYGSIIPRSTSIACGTLPGDWIANQYYYTGGLLTVRLQIDPVAALHPDLELCLWAGGMTAEHARLLACAPVKQP